MKKIAIVASVSYLFGLGIVGYASYKTNGFYAPQTIKTKEHRVILEYCKDEYIAEELSKSKYPYLMTALAKTESDFRPLIKGDGGDSFGMFQISRKNWGDTNERIPNQIKKCEKIYEHFAAKVGKVEGIRAYNGQGRKARAYQRKVLRIVKLLQEREKTI